MEKHTEFTITPRTKVKRLPQRADYDKEAIYRFLDETFVCHVGFYADGYVTVIPTAHWRIDNRFYIHGAKTSRMVKILSSGVEACINVVLLDGLVLARSAFHHSMNYRSAVIFGKAEVIENPQEKMLALEHFIEHIAAGRWEEIRHPTEQELRATTVLAFDLTEASSKIRTGPPVDDLADHALPVWAGEIPLQLQRGEPITDPLLTADIPVPDYARGLSKSMP